MGVGCSVQLVELLCNMGLIHDHGKIIATMVATHVAYAGAFFGSSSTFKMTFMNIAEASSCRACTDMGSDLDQ